MFSSSWSIEQDVSMAIANSPPWEDLTLLGKYKPLQV